MRTRVGLLNLEDGGSSSSLAEDNNIIEVLCKQYGSVRDCQCTGEAGNERFPGNLKGQLGIRTDEDKTAT